jgi:hypothetical protein
MRSLLPIVIGVLLLPWATVAGGQSPEEERDSLRGLRGVMVLVEKLHADATSIELTREDLQREIGYRFKRAGIRILTAEERVEDERRPYLYVNCNVLYIPDLQLTSFSIDVELHQDAELKDGQKLPVLTWARSYLGIQHRDRAAAAIRSRLGEFLEQFISDYQFVNKSAESGETG